MKLKRKITFVLFLLLSLKGLSQIRLQGKVVNEDQHPVSHVNICFQSKPTGTTTDLDGNFWIEISDEEEFMNDSIVFRHLNYKDKTLAFKDFKENSCVILKQDYHQLNEVGVYAQYAQNSYKLALKNAKETDKPILLFFTADWCGICHYYKQLFTEKNEINEYLKENYLLVFCDILTKPGMKLKRLYGVGSGLPKFVIITSDERRIAKFDRGWENQDECLQFLKKYSKLPQNLESYKKIRQTNYNFEINAPRKRPIVKFDEQMKNTDWRIFLHLGLMNITNIKSSNHNYRSHKLGYDFGFSLMHYKVGNPFSIRGGLLFSSQGGRSPQGSKSFRINYLEIPVRLDYQFRNTRFLSKIGAGPYISCGLAAKNKQANERIKFGSGENRLKRWDYGVIPGVTVSPLGNLEIFTGYKIGFNNISNHPTIKMYNRGFYFRLSIKFFGKRTW